MPRPGHRPPELAIPVASLAALRNALAQEVGGDAAARALAAAGKAAGDALFSQIAFGGEAEDGTTSVSTLSETVFWRRLSQLFSSRGWGTLAHHNAHEGVGALEAPDWVEADPEARAGRPSCFFTTGMLANLLGNAAGDAVSVLEVECRSRGDERCRFLFGSAAALDALYERVGSGESAESALAGL